MPSTAQKVGAAGATLRTGTAALTIPAGQECDDGVCKAHKGG